MCIMNQTQLSTYLRQQSIMDTDGMKYASCGHISNTMRPLRTDIYVAGLISTVLISANSQYPFRCQHRAHIDSPPGRECGYPLVFQSLTCISHCHITLMWNETLRPFPIFNHIHITVWMCICWFAVNMNDFFLVKSRKESFILLRNQHI